jgi:hypothetical protein
MKKVILKATMVLAFSIISLGLFADPPNVPGGHGESGDQAPPAGGGAPIGSGIALLIAMGSAYGTFRMKAQNEE